MSERRRARSLSGSRERNDKGLSRARSNSLVPYAHPTRRPGQTEASSSRGPSHDYVPSKSDTGSESALSAEVVGCGAVRGRRVLPVDIITRPKELVTKQGQFGKATQMTTNYFKIFSAPEWCLYQYRVDFEPKEDSKVICKGLLRQHKETLGAYIFDGTVLYTINEYPQPLELTSERQSDQQMMTIKLRKVGDMTRGDQHYIQFFNIIMRKCLDNLDLQLVGRNYFDAKTKVTIREYQFELWPGFITSIHQHEQDILMCVDITHKIIDNETLQDVFMKYYNQDILSYKRDYMHKVVGTQVLTSYNNKTYRIDDVDFDVSPKSTFIKKDGTVLSYSDYYKQRYGITVKFLFQPLLVSQSKPRHHQAGKSEVVYLIPELCRCTGLSSSMRNNHQLMNTLSGRMQMSPAGMIQKLGKFNQQLYSVKQTVEELKSWNLQLDRNLVQLPARILPRDQINYGNDILSVVPLDADWTRDFPDRRLIKCEELNDWVLLVPIKVKNDCHSFVSALRRVAQKMNFVIGDPKIFDMPDDSPFTYVNKLEEIKSKLNPKLIFCVVFNNKGSTYSVIKKKCCVDRPVPTQVVLAKSLKPGKCQMSIATKVAIQMNCKIGGFPWVINIPLQGSMVVGFDVCHDTNIKGKNFGALVASLDGNFGRYYSVVSSHCSEEELSSELSINLCKALDKFKKHNSTLPKKIVIFRNGVSKSQIPFIVQHEVNEINSKLGKMYESPDDIKLAYIIVTKKINTRLFYNNQNPPPGTVVDNAITDPTRYDFLIVSQSLEQGTVCPTYYNVVCNTSGLDVDKIQRLTYKLCHMYFNWTGIIRIPAPCQYAYKLANLVSQWIHESPDSLLDTVLYFL